MTCAADIGADLVAISALSTQKAANAKDDIGVTKKDLAEGVKAKQTLYQDRRAKSQSLAVEDKRRDEESNAPVASSSHLARSGAASGTGL